MHFEDDFFVDPKIFDEAIEKFHKDPVVQKNLAQYEIRKAKSKEDTEGRYRAITIKYKNIELHQVRFSILNEDTLWIDNKIEFSSPMLIDCEKEAEKYNKKYNKKHGNNK